MFNNILAAVWRRVNELLQQINFKAIFLTLVSDKFKTCKFLSQIIAQIIEDWMPFVFIEMFYQMSGKAKIFRR